PPPGARCLHPRCERCLLRSRLDPRRTRPAGSGRVVDERAGSAAASPPLGRDRIGDVEARGGPSLRVSASSHVRGRPRNTWPEGRELNRRVEIHGQGTEVQRARLYDVYRGQASSRIGGLSAAVDSAGRFSCSVPLPPGDTLAVTLSDRLGRTTSALVRLPSLEIIEPRGEVRVPYGGTAPGVSVGPHGAASGPPQVAGLGAAQRAQAA